ncbi:homocysteine S-methyltransferase family protein [Actinomycetospora sp. NBRC 106378]|uniref:homocysteine S-methyltransferase family protein n=1 Tax=Actinomycetospora sp. NBRC 106378 TaxID=3032208 RepID=UPI0024A0C712|nr:homocysteine S-methyltransferase family protein [Actinomycetospora sp. NBRC 106378]GLZ54217.1 bifunctional homocysteine S-methyltransferase/methylenetetrahydrofolate reductase [Actinomycetospora sp. NBRC 106378]
MNVAEALAAGTLLGDGAMGTLAQATGARAEGAVSELVLLAPELVGALHRRYLDAGAELIQTHTYGASRLRLARHGLARRVHEINVDAARLAREARDDTARPAFVAGSISPATSPRLAGPVEPSAVRAAIREQAAALAEGGVDLLVCETFAHAEELAEAVLAVREATDLPVIAQATFVEEDGGPVTTLGETPEEVARVVGALGPVALGTNCTLGPQGLLTVVRRLVAAVPDGIAVTALPNAGLPHVVSDRSVRFASDAAHFGRYAARYVAAGARLVGGCCGTTPAHVAAAAAELSRGPVVDEPVAAPLPLPAGRKASLLSRDDSNDAFLPPTARAEGPGRGAVARWLDAPRRTPLLVAEVTAPGADDLDVHVARGRAALAAGAAALWAGRERTRRRRTTTAGVAAGLHEVLDADVACTVTSWNSSRMALQADLLGLDALGLHTIVTETGNPPVHADRAVRDGVWEVDAVGLVGLAASLAAGVDTDGLRLAPAPFRVGVRVTPGTDDLEREMHRVRLKVEAGAEFLVTRPVYELDRLRRVLGGIGTKVPVLLSLAPLSGYAEAEHLAHEVPDVVLPDHVLARVRAAGEDPAPGLDLAADLAAEALAEGLVEGIVVRRPGPPALLGEAVTRLGRVLTAAGVGGRS